MIEIEIEIDYSNHEQLVDLMDHADDYPCMLMGENTDGEFVTTSILEDKIVVDALQSNGWTRTNIFHRDGTVEEFYSRK